MMAKPGRQILLNLNTNNLIINAYKTNQKNNNFHLYHLYVPPKSFIIKGTTTNFVEKSN